MGRLSTHVLDTVSGGPAEGVTIELHRLMEDGGWREILRTQTNADGRTAAPLLSGAEFGPGTYMISFHIGAHFATATPFLDIVPVRFTVADPEGHYHVPLLVSPWSYTTYRGS